MSLLLARLRGQSVREEEVDRVIQLSQAETTELAAAPDTLPMSTTPVAIAGFKFTSIAAGTLYTCGLTASGAVYCWGWNYAGNLGDGTTTTRTAPTLVETPVVFASIITSSENLIALTTCGVTRANALYCWGWGGNGQLGNPSEPTSTNWTDVL